jgi:hypothetical protein
MPTGLVAGLLLFPAAALAMEVGGTTSTPSGTAPFGNPPYTAPAGSPVDPANPPGYWRNEKPKNPKKAEPAKKAQPETPAPAGSSPSPK